MWNYEIFVILVTLRKFETTVEEEEVKDLQQQNQQNSSISKGIQKYLAYNCNLKDNLEFEEYSLMEVEKCNSTAKQYDDPIEMEALVIKPKKILQIDVIECNLKASFMVNYCSYHLISGYRHWEGNIIGNNIQLHLSKTECIQAIRDHQLKYMDRRYYQKYNYIIIDMQNNGIASGWKTLRGSINAKKGTCTPDSFAILGEQYSSHVLQMKYDISIKGSRKNFNIMNRVLRLNEHLAINNVISGSYFDPTYGNFHWDNKEISNTSHHIWQEVLTGSAKLHNPKLTSTTKPIAIIKFQNNTIALTLEEKERICIEKFHSCREAYKTASKEIYLILTNSSNRNWKLEKVTYDNIDKIEDIKSSAISMFLTNSLEIEDSFAKVSRILCEKNRNLILTDIKKYLTKIPNQESTHQDIIEAGSTIYSVKCKQILVWLAPKNSICYKEPRIGYLDEDRNIPTYAHIHPISHHIQPNSTQITCDNILPFKIAMKTIDNLLEYFCRTKNGWSYTNCEIPQKIQPLAVEAIYKTNTKRIHTSMLDSQSITLLDQQQWNVINNEENSQTMLKMFNQIRNSQPKIKNVFEHLLQQATNQILHTPIQWLHNVSDIIMPAITLTYILNVITGLTIAVPSLRKRTKHEAITLKHLFSFILDIIKALFPIFVQTRHTCKCEEEIFLSEVARKVEDQERTRFLNNLMN